MSARFVDEHDFGFGWLEEATIQRTSHALVAHGRAWLIDPFEADGVEERLRALGEPAGVIQLLDRHGRDSAAYAARLGVPLHVLPSALPGTPFELIPVVRNRFWKESALWWPERRVLVAADALGTVPNYFRAGDEPLGIHPLLRLTPPRALAGLEPLHVLVGHGEGVHGEHVTDALDRALRQSRRRIPRLVAGLPKLLRERR